MFWVDEVKRHMELAEPPEEIETVPGLHETVKPVEGVTDSVRLTLPEKPPRLVRLTVDEALEPAGKPTVDGLADTAKSATMTLIWTE